MVVLSKACTAQTDLKRLLIMLVYLPVEAQQVELGMLFSELITEDGTIPLKVVICCLADTTGLLWRREERNVRLFCVMPDALFITHIYFVGQHPPHGMVWDYA
ncbi:MAG: hypothetical protein ACKPKO_32390 [Candidatus Fonsibacter sp.]